METNPPDKDLKPCPFCGKGFELIPKVAYCPTGGWKHWCENIVVFPEGVSLFCPADIEYWNSAYCWKELDKRDERIKSLEDELNGQSHDIIELEKEKAELIEALETSTKLMALYMSDLKDDQKMDARINYNVGILSRLKSHKEGL